MKSFLTMRRWPQFVVGFAALVWLVPVTVGDLNLDPKAIHISSPDQIQWKEGNGSANAVLYGDPTKPGLYINLTKWYPHHNSRPHYHPNDRYITVMKGTWWVATGTNYDPDHFVPVKQGSFVVHTGKEVHYDGAKDEEVVLEMVGMGPATSISAEKGNAETH